MNVICTLIFLRCNKRHYFKSKVIVLRRVLIFNEFNVAELYFIFVLTKNVFFII